MFDIKEQQDQSAELDQTINPDRTDSEKSDDVQVLEVPTKLGLQAKTSESEDQKEEVKAEEKAEIPLEQAATDEQT